MKNFLLGIGVTLGAIWLYRRYGKNKPTETKVNGEVPVPSEANILDTKFWDEIVMDFSNRPVGVKPTANWVRAIKRGDAYYRVGGTGIVAAFNSTPITKEEYEKIKVEFTTK